jgi:FAD binding domain/Berberine and berberine like
MPHSASTLTFATTIILALSSAASAQSLLSCVQGTGATVSAPSIDPVNFNTLNSRSLNPSPAPNLIAQPSSVTQVQAVVNCARKNGAKVCTRSGGHSFTGSAHCTGVMIDMRNIRFWTYNAAGQTMNVGTGSTLGELFYNTMSRTGDSRLIGVGLCPSVGVGGYLLGGGHNPYSGLTGLTCESLQSIRVVLADGSLVTASASSNSELFWASCGGGGGNFGIAVDAVLKTTSAAPFNQNVYFRFSWPRSQAGTLISKFIDYNQDGGNSWVRLEVNTASPVFAYGVCWNTASTSACINRLSGAAFFQEPNRVQNFIKSGSSARDFQVFIGPNGGWANFAADPGATNFVNQVYLDAGNAAKRVYSSSFLGYGDAASKPSVATLQQLADTCASVNGNIVEWIVCQFNPWRGAASNDVVNPGGNAFGNKRGDKSIFTEFIGQTKSGAAGINELKRVEAIVKSLTRPFLAGTYVSYPELRYSVTDYSYLYYGQKLQRLANLKAALDPNKLFAHNQALPSGVVSCPGNLAVTSPSSTTRSISITGYNIGQLALMQATFQLTSGCSVSSTVNGQIVGSSGVQYTIQVYNNRPVTIGISSSNPGACAVRTLSVNGIACSGGSVSPTNPPGTTVAPGGSSGTSTVRAGATCTPTNSRCRGAPGQPTVPWLGGCCSSAAVCRIDVSKGWGEWCVVGSNTIVSA